MRTLTFSPPKLLPTVETSRPRMLDSRGEMFDIDVPADATVTHGDGGDDPLLTVRWSNAEVRVIAHREVGVMTARDYGAEIFGVVRRFEPTGRDLEGGYGVFAGRDAPLLRGSAGDRTLVAMCAAPGVTRLIAIGSSLVGDTAAASEVRAVIASISPAVTGRDPLH